MACCVAGACFASFEQSARTLSQHAEPVEPGLQRRRSYHDKAATRLKAEWQELAQPGKPAVQHGRRTEYHADGTLALVRHFEHGEPTGLWRAWYADGTLRMEVDYNASESISSWWHPGGVLASRGPARWGARWGVWEHHRADGTLASRGTYANGVRHGMWTYFDERGAWTERGRYVNGARIGAWERAHTPGSD